MEKMSAFISLATSPPFLDISNKIYTQVLLMVL